MSDLTENLNRQKKPLAPKVKYLTGLVLILALGAGYGYWAAASSKPVEEFSQWSKPVPVRVVAVERRDLNVEL